MRKRFAGDYLRVRGLFHINTFSIKDEAARGVWAVLAVSAEALVCYDKHDRDNSDCDGKHDDNEPDDIPDGGAVERADAEVHQTGEGVQVDGVALVQKHKELTKNIYRNKLPFSCAGVYCGNIYPRALRCESVFILL
jgi:hypothetical protein